MTVSIIMAATRATRRMTALKTMAATRIDNNRSGRPKRTAIATRQMLVHENERSSNDASQNHHNKFPLKLSHDAM